MSPLATRIYKHLVTRLRRNQQSVTYGQLAVAVDVHPRSPALHAALGQIRNACRRNRLPCLPAMVWRADRHRPGGGYYQVAHPRAHTDPARLAAWERELARVVSAAGQYPARLTCA